MATFTLCCCVIALPILVLGYGQEWKYDERPASTASITEQKIEKSERGWIGCMYNRKVCEDGERCIDDGLFGVCRSRQAGVSPSMLLFNYQQLDSEWRRILETELALLAADGYKWTDVYTQCILRSTLLAYRSGSLRDAAVCVQAGTRANEAASPLAEVEAAWRARKRDAALTLHKYFDGGQPVYDEEEAWIDADDVARMRRQLAVLDRLQQRARSTLNTDDVRDLPPQEGNDDLSLVEALVRNKVGSQQRKRAGGMGHANMKSSARNMDTGRALRQLRPSKRREAHSDVGNAAHARQAAEVESAEAEAELEQATPRPRKVVDSRWVFLSLGWPAEARRGFGSAAEVRRFLDAVEKAVGLPPKLYDDFELSDGEVDFHLPPHLQRRPQAVVARLNNVTRPLPGGPVILGSGFGRAQEKVAAARLAPKPKHFGVTFAVCGGVLFIIAAAIVLFLLQRHRRSRSKLDALTQQAEQGESRDAYQELCRQRMAARSSDKPEPLSAAARAVGPALSRHDSNSAGSTRSSTSSWSEEPIHSNMDISTGHLILSYMEEHLNNKEKLESEWNNLCAYQPDVVKCDVGKREENLSRNRYLDNIPYDNSRVELKTAFEGSTYFNASYVINHDPKNPVYIVTQGPLANTTAQFWQMVWEQGSIVIVNLTRLVEDGISLCQKYWPEEGSELYNNYEVHLVSEHVWCEDYLVRSFYLKNVTTGETRTVTQFHFLSWPDLGEPSAVKTLLDFRRKVNKSYKGRSCPVVVHCSDGCGRSGTYILLDMVLNRLAKGVKEIDISAAVEHLRDQRCQMVKTRGQFEFVLTAIAEEVHAMLKSLPQ